MGRVAWFSQGILRTDRQPRRRRGSAERWVRALTVVALAIPLAVVPGTVGAQAKASAPAVPGAKAVSGVKTLTPKKIKVQDGTKRAYKATAANWPTAATGSATLANPVSGHTQGTKATVGSTPVWAQTVAPSTGTYRGPSKVTVHVLAHKQATALGVPGVVFTVKRAGSGKGGVRVGLNYAKFAQIYGGNYGSRLHLVQLPACALTTPKLAACRKQTPLATDLSPAAKSLSAKLTLASASTAAAPSLITTKSWSVPQTTTAATVSADAVLAATDDSGQEGGSAGSYAATVLKPAGSWSAGGSAGSFTYSYPVVVPAASAPLQPTVGLSYDSGSVDGQTSSTQAQSSWVGDGWSTPDSYIEQNFVPCSDSPEGSASPTVTNDECYDGQILTLSLNGSSTSLVYDSSANTYTAADDNGEKIKHITGSGNGSGTYNTDYWTVTERDGTTYMFGRNELPGWASGKATTNSVDSIPVYSAHSGDPCYSSSGFTSSVCTMAYKWHLDYVVDAHSSAMSYYYAQNTNYYGQDKGATNTSYVRDSHLARIDYGFLAGGAYGTVPDQVVFTTAVRCTASTCDTLSSTTAASEYPDVPYDLNCASGATCSAYSPSFWSTVRLASITTKQYSTASSAYAAVDTYTFNETEPATGDGTSPTLWLSSITHTGNDTTAGGSTASISLPSVSFTGTDLQNRVDVSNFPGLYRFRVSSITNEMGGVIGVTYSLPSQCTASYVASATPSSNTKSCYPVYWTPKDYTAPVLDWFEKYAVTQVLESDATGGATIQQTDYTYAGAAWHYDDNELVKAKYRTYGQFRGYGSVTTLTGDNANDPQTKSVTTYYQGMDGDYLSSSSTRSVSVTDSQGGTHLDKNQLAGNVLESTAYKGSGGAVDHSTITSYWVSAAVASRSRTGLPDLTANTVQSAESWTRQALTDGGTTTWRYAETDDTYDDTTTDTNFGLLTHSYTHTVPANTAYDQCATTTYAPANTSLNIVGLVASQETDSVACSSFTEGSTTSVPNGLNALGAPSSVSRPDQVETATRTYYDDTTFSTTFPQTVAPTIGDVTMTRQAVTYASGAFTWQTSKRETYDTYGRQQDTYDGNGNKTSIAYTVNSVGLTTGETVTNAKSQTSSLTADPTRGLVLTATDANNVVTTSHYDALGRVTAIWTNSRATTANANTTYAYTVSKTGLTGTVTQKLNDSLGYATSVTIYDSLGRVRQAQTPTPQGGRLVTESFYDSHGWVRKANNAYWDSATTPTLALVSVQDSQIPNQDLYTFDGLGRTVVDDSEQYSVTKQETTTVYNGDTTTVIPPSGGTVKATTTDPLGRTTALEEYSTAPTVTKPGNTFTGTWYTTGGTGTTTAYGYDGHGNKATTASAGSTWTSTYNLLGQVTAKTDPDSGNSSLSYDADGNLTQTTDSRSDTVSYTYDVLNRKTGEYASTTDAQSAGASGNQIAAWVYDNDNTAVTSMTNPVGHVTTATSYTGGYAYVTQALGFNVYGESLGETVTIPSGAQGTTLGKAYTFKHTYTAGIGLPYSDIYPAAGGLPAETISHTYSTALDLPSGLGDTSYAYAQSTTYDAYGNVAQEEIGSASTPAYLTNTHDPHTGALTDQLVTRSTTTPATVDDEAYTYDPAGNITQQVSTRLGSSATSETQCYTYDGLDRLSSAWTATGACAATPTSSNASTVVGDSLGTTSAYWTSWTYTATGQRQTQTQHSTTTGGSDTTTTYTYDGNGKSQAHTLTSDTAGDSYTYDAAGNTYTRTTAATGSQALTWNNVGQLTAITTSSAGVSYIYDADGDLLIKADPTTKTLYLPGEQITLNTSAGTTTGVRYFALPGGGTAVRTGTGTNYDFEITDPHGTSGLYLDHTGQTPTWRQFTPYGAPRGTTSTWLDDRGFLNKPTDTTTGLTTVGARQYDPTTGTFLSLDPVLDDSNPGTLNGYSYTANNPVGQSDPTGLDDWYNDPNENKCVVDCATSPIGESAGGKLGKGKAIPVYTHVSPDVAVQGDSKLLHDIGKDWAAEYRKHYRGFAKGTRLGPWEDDLLWADMCKDNAGLCSQEVVNAIHAASVANAGGSHTGIIFSACEFTPSGCGKGFSGALLLADRSVSLTTAKTPQKFAIADFSAGAPGLLENVYTGCNSFMGKTRVLMADNTDRAIDQVKSGDRIRDALPGATAGSRDEINTVTAVHVTKTDHDYINVTVATRSGRQSVVGTAHHLYWDATARAWTQASDLRVGHRVQTLEGATVAIVALHPYTARMVTYNLSVASLHAYYVIAGATPVLVHNCGEESEEYIYRGVKYGHSKYQYALEGKAVPRGGDADAASHNGGNTDSEFTSWTEDYEGVALDAALEGNGPGVVLRFRRSDVQERLVEGTQDIYGESEILIEGEIGGAEVSINGGDWHSPGEE